MEHCHGSVLFPAARSVPSGQKASGDDAFCPSPPRGRLGHCGALQHLARPGVASETSICGARHRKLTFQRLGAELWLFRSARGADALHADRSSNSVAKKLFLLTSTGFKKTVRSRRNKEVILPLNILLPFSTLPLRPRPAPYFFYRKEIWKRNDEGRRPSTGLQVVPKFAAAQ